MRWLLILLFIANVAMSVTGLFFLPERIAIHFGAEGKADGWGSKWVSFAASLFMDVFFLILFLFADKIVFWFPPKWVNMPNREYWLRPERKQETREKFSPLMWRLGIAFYLFFLVIGCLTLQANLSQPVQLGESFFFVVLGAFFAYTAYWCVRFYQAFRLPSPSSMEGDPS